MWGWGARLWWAGTGSAVAWGWRCRIVGHLKGLRSMTRTAVCLFAGVILSVSLFGCGGRYRASASDMEQAASRTSPVIGRRAPEFTLLDQDEKEVTLGGLKGKWVVLYFYPRDDTPGCSCEATEFTALLGPQGDGEHVGRGGMVPSGTGENSPAIHRWDHGIDHNPVPSGTEERFDPRHA